MLVFFVLLTLIVQIGFLVIARNATSVALEGAVRQAGTDSGDLTVVRDRLERNLHATVPGTQEAEIEMTSNGRIVTGTVSFVWVPPGPDLIPVTISVTRQAPIVVPP
jgi:hypothetical protein